MVSLCRSRHIVPVLMTPPPVDPERAHSHWTAGTDYEKVNQKISILCGLMEEYAKKSKTALIPLHDRFEALLQANQNIRYLQDGIHPTKAGHRSIAHFVTDWAKKRFSS